jgi:hypothetical protein
MRTDFHASTVAPWGARARGPAARCGSCGSATNRWVMAGFPGKRWDLDCCRGGRSGAVLRGGAAGPRTDLVLPRGWDVRRLLEESSRPRASEGDETWSPIPAEECQAALSAAGIPGPAEPAEARRPENDRAPQRPANEPESSSDEESLGLLPTFHFAKG